MLMDLKEAIEKRHSVRQYIKRPLSLEIIEELKGKYKNVIKKVVYIFNS